jgi:hypothetical protein
VQAAALERTGTLFPVAQFPCDVRGSPLVVGDMVVDADKINNGVTKGKAVVVLHGRTSWGRSGRRATVQDGDSTKPPSHIRARFLEKGKSIRTCVL